MRLPLPLRVLARRVIRDALAEHAPAALEVADAIEAAAAARDPIEAPRERARARRAAASPATGAGAPEVVAVEILDERGCCVGYTTAEVLRRSEK